MGSTIGEGRVSIEDEPWTGRPKSVTGDLSIEIVGKFLRSDSCCSIEEISKYTEILNGKYLSHSERKSRESGSVGAVFAFKGPNETAGRMLQKLLQFENAMYGDYMR